MKPYPFQEEALKWLETRPKAFIAMEPGLGKTIVSSLDAVPPVMVVTTSAMVYTFEREVNKWRPDLTTQVITTRDVPEHKADVVLYPWTAMAKHQPYIRQTGQDIKTLILDESHYAKTPTAKRTRAAVKLIKQAERVRLLSGTPVVSRPMDLFALAKAIGIISMDWRSYAFKYCAAWESPFGFVTSGASNLDELYTKLEPKMLRMTKRKYAPQLKEPVRRVIELDQALPKEEKEFIKANLETPDSSIPFEAISDIRKMNAQRKLPLALQYIEDVLETEKKVVVFAHHQEIVKALKDGLETYEPVAVSGVTSAKDKFEYVERFQADEKCRVFVGNIAAASEAITLTAASRVIFAEVPWTPSEIDQAISRCDRLGQSSQVQADFLVTRKSIDSRMLAVCLEKMDVINQLVKETKAMKTSLTSSRETSARETSARIASLFRQLADAFETEAALAKTEKPKIAAASPIPEVQLPTNRKIKIEDIRVAAAAIIAAGGRDVVVSALEECGAEKLSSLDESKFEEFLKIMSRREL